MLSQYNLILAKLYRSKSKLATNNRSFYVWLTFTWWFQWKVCTASTSLRSISLAQSSYDMTRLKLLWCKRDSLAQYSYTNLKPSSFQCSSSSVAELTKAEYSISCVTRYTLIFLNFWFWLTLGVRMIALVAKSSKMISSKTVSGAKLLKKLGIMSFSFFAEKSSALKRF